MFNLGKGFWGVMRVGGGEGEWGSEGFVWGEGRGWGFCVGEGRVTEGFLVGKGEGGGGW